MNRANTVSKLVEEIQNTQSNNDAHNAVSFYAIGHASLNNENSDESFDKRSEGTCHNKNYFDNEMGEMCLNNNDIKDDNETEDKSIRDEVTDHANCRDDRRVCDDAAPCLSVSSINVTIDEFCELNSDQEEQKQKRKKNVGFYKCKSESFLLRKVVERSRDSVTTKLSSRRRSTFADIVTQLMTPQIQEDIHPFGRGHLYKAAIDQRNKRIHNDEGRILIWVFATFLIVAITTGIIVMAEMYGASTRAKYRRSWNSSLNFS